MKRHSHSSDISSISIVLALLVPFLAGCLEQMLGSIAGSQFEVGQGESGFEIEFKLEDGSPAPDPLELNLARPVTNFEFALPIATEVLILVADERGVAIIVHREEYEAGIHRILLNFDGQSSGVYVAKIFAGPFSAGRTIILAK